MSLLQGPRCPICHSALPIRALWDFARLEESKVLIGLGFLNRWGLMREKVGLACPSCGAKLKIVQTRIVIVRLAAWAIIVMCAAWFGIRNAQMHFVSDQRVVIAVTLGVFGIFALLQRLWTPILAQVRPVGVGERVSYPLESAYEANGFADQNDHPDGSDL
jgi:hypothetical protein